MRTWSLYEPLADGAAGFGWSAGEGGVIGGGAFFGGSFSGDGSAAVVLGKASSFAASFAGPGSGTGGSARIGTAGFSPGVGSLAQTASPHTPRADAINMVRQYFKGILPPQCSVQ